MSHSSSQINRGSVESGKATLFVQLNVNRSLLLSAISAVGIIGSTTTAPAPTFAKEYDIAGTVDCGLRSGEACVIADSVKLWTDDVSGTRELITIDTAWIKKDFAGLDQDEAIDLEVRDEQAAVGGIRGIGIAGEGSFVNRLNFGVEENYTTCKDSIQANVGRAKSDDEAMARNNVKSCDDLRK